MKLRQWTALTCALAFSLGAASISVATGPADLKRAESEYTYHVKAVSILDEHRLLLQSVADMAESRFKAGQGSQHGVLRAQLEALKLVGRRTEHENRLQAAKSLINRHHSRPRDTRIELPPAGPPLHDLPSPEELVQSALKHSASAVSRGESSSERNQHTTREQATSDLFAAIEGAHAQAATARQRIQLYGTSFIPLAGAALESALGSYQAGTTDLQGLIDVLLMGLDARMDLIRAEADYRKALSELATLTGLDLTR